MSLIPDLHADLAEQATALALELQLGLKDQHGRLQHSPLTLVPWQLQHDDWQAAREVSRAVGARLLRLAADDSALERALGPAVAGNSLPARLWQAWQDIPPGQRRAAGVNLMRVDLLQDNAGAWKLVEANTIAAGMGPFSEGLLKVQQTLWPAMQAAGWVANRAEPRWLADPITAAMAEALLDAAQQQARRLPTPDPLAVVFVVEPREDNIFDQRKVALALQQRGVRVLRRTLAQLAAQWEADAAPVLRLRDLGRVHALYFRTGYNLQDYRDATGQTAPLLRWRAMLETLAVALAPSIPLQLASAKAVQVHWYQCPERDAAAASVDTPQYYLDDPDRPAMPVWQDWLLKSQGEGGGNVIEGDAIPPRIASLSGPERHDWLLMRRIDARVRTELVPVLRQGQIQMTTRLVSELGVFLTGDALRAEGYLVRSKPERALESGVHRAGGAIDTLALLS